MPHKLDSTSRYKKKVGIVKEYIFTRYPHFYYILFYKEGEGSHRLELPTLLREALKRAVALQLSHLSTSRLRRVNHIVTKSCT